MSQVDDRNMGTVCVESFELKEISSGPPAPALRSDQPVIIESNPGGSNDSPPRESGYAVVVRDAHFKYESSEKEVLCGLNIATPRGSSHILIGYAGAGKTTLLKALSGQCRLNSGTVSIVGSEPSQYVDAVYSKVVGVMPQDVALYKECSALEFLEYFGNLFGVPKSTIKKRIRELSAVFRVKYLYKNITFFSHGQQRRISLMATMIHNPSLLLLDEPFAGYDQVLDARIWEYFNNRAKQEGLTILMVSSNLLEGVYAHKMTIIHNGQNVMEGTYDSLKPALGYNTIYEGVGRHLKKLDKKKRREGRGETNRGFESSQGDISNQDQHVEASSLETVQVQDENESNGGDDAAIPVAGPILEGITSVASPEEIQHLQKAKSNLGIPVSLRRIKAMAILNMTRLFRSRLLLSFTLLVPIMEVASMYLFYGRSPIPITVGVFNGELLANNLTNCAFRDLTECSMELLSCNFLQYLPNDTIELIQYDSEEKLMAAAYRGDMNGYLNFNAEFSKTLQLWMLTDGSLSPESAKKQEIAFGIDGMDFAFSSNLDRAVNKAIDRFMQEHMIACDVDYKPYLVPYSNRFVVVGNDITTYGECAAVGTLLLILFYLPMVATAVILMKNDKDGSIERNVANGVRLPEYFMAQFVTQTGFLLIQTVSAIIVLRVMYGRDFEGSWWPMELLAILVGWSGITAGFFMGAIIQSPMLITILTIAAIVPNMALAGVVWPIQAYMGGWVEYMGILTPIGIPIEALEHIVNAGAGFDSDYMAWGAGAAVFWICAFTFFTAILNRNRVY